MSRRAGHHVFGLLIAWNVVVRALGENPTAGAGGVEGLLRTAQLATNPLVPGWAVDDHRGLTTDWWQPLLPGHPVYPIAALANLVFTHLWLLDNVWQEVPPWLHAVQHVLLVLALGALASPSSTGGGERRCWR